MNDSLNDLRAYWRHVRAYYKRINPLILAAPANKWAVDRYAWDFVGGIVMTPIESALWHDICAERAVLYPQYPVGRFLVDFGNPVARVAIECDGAAWHTDAAKDQARQAEIQAMGWRVYRITGRDCLADYTENEDEETGHVSIIPSPARALIRRVVESHGIAWEGSCDGPRLMGELVAGRLEHYEKLRGLQ